MSNEDLIARTGSAFKQMAKSIYILSCTQDGVRHASVSSAVSNVSNAPPSLLICMEKTASFSGLLTADTAFAVNILGAEHLPVVEHCMGAKGESRFDVGEWIESHGQPILSDAQASFVCRVSAVNGYETHNIVIADIEEAICREERSALIYVNGKFVPLHSL